MPKKKKPAETAPKEPQTENTVMHHAFFRFGKGYVIFGSHGYRASAGVHNLVPQKVGGIGAPHGIRQVADHHEDFGKNGFQRTLKNRKRIFPVR